MTPIYVPADALSPVTLTYGGLDLNDGVVFHLREGFDFGEPDKSFAEFRGYDGTVRQYGVHEANLVAVTLPLKITAVGMTIQAAIDLINASIDAGTQTLVYDENNGDGPQSYNCVESPRLSRAHGIEERSADMAFVTLMLWRTP